MQVRKIGGGTAVAAVFAMLFLLTIFKLAGNVDIHVMRMGKWDIAFVCAVLGTIMVLAVSILLDSAKGAGRWLRYMGINSLFIMATHIDFRVNVFVHWILSKLGLMTYRYVAFIQIVLLCLIECILCRLCSPWVDKVINRMMKKLMIERICDEH